MTSWAWSVNIFQFSFLIFQEPVDPFLIYMSFFNPQCLNLLPLIFSIFSWMRTNYMGSSGKWDVGWAWLKHLLASWRSYLSLYGLLGSGRILLDWVAFCLLNFPKKKTVVAENSAWFWNWFNLAKFWIGGRRGHPSADPELNGMTNDVKSLES